MILSWFSRQTFWWIIKMDNETNVFGPCRALRGRGHTFEIYPKTDSAGCPSAGCFSTECLQGIRHYRTNRRKDLHVWDASHKWYKRIFPIWRRIMGWSCPVPRVKSPNQSDTLGHPTTTNSCVILHWYSLRRVWQKSWIDWEDFWEIFFISPILIPKSHSHYNILTFSL